MCALCARGLAPARACKHGRSQACRDRKPRANRLPRPTSTPQGSRARGAPPPCAPRLTRACTARRLLQKHFLKPAAELAASAAQARRAVRLAMRFLQARRPSLVAPPWRAPAACSAALAPAPRGSARKRGAGGRRWYIQHGVSARAARSPHAVHSVARLDTGTPSPRRRRPRTCALRTLPARMPCPARAAGARARSATPWRGVAGAAAPLRGRAHIQHGRNRVRARGGPATGAGPRRATRVALCRPRRLHPCAAFRPRGADLSVLRMRLWGTLERTRVALKRL